MLPHGRVHGVWQVTLATPAAAQKPEFMCPGAHQAGSRSAGPAGTASSSLTARRRNGARSSLTTGEQERAGSLVRGASPPGPGPERCQGAGPPIMAAGCPAPSRRATPCLPSPTATRRGCCCWRRPWPSSRWAGSSRRHAGAPSRRPGLVPSRNLALFYSFLQGTYAALDGGSTLWALEALTGDYVFKFKYEVTNGVSASAPGVQSWWRWALRGSWG